MPLLPRDEVWPLLVCPRCRSALARGASGLHCSSGSCAYRDGGERRFPMVGTHPALIDFERSIVNQRELIERGGQSLVERAESRGPGAGARRLFVTPNPVAERHARAMGERLRARSPQPTLLVVGGGTVGTGASALYSDPALRIVAFDLYASPWTQWIADAHAIPLADRSVDGVWIQAVLEHVLDPARVVSELVRVLKDDGLVYAETPFMQQVHEGPYDFTRFTESGHRWLFRRFERLDSGVVAGCGTQFAWTLDYATRGLFRSRFAGRLTRLLTFWMHALDAVIPERFAVDDASCVFFFGRKWHRELEPSEIVSHYRGAQRAGPSS